MAVACKEETAGVSNRDSLYRRPQSDCGARFGMLESIGATPARCPSYTDNPQSTLAGMHNTARRPPIPERISSADYKCNAGHMG